MRPYGNFGKKILVIGESPGEVEDEKGKPWQGKTGQLLQRTLAKLGIDLFRDCLSTNACRCRPVGKDGENRSPTNLELDCCRQSLLQTIEEYKPKIIIPLGSAAVYSLLNHRWQHDKLQGISRWRGWIIPDQEFKAWICPTYHPSYIERTEEDSPERTIWEKDLQHIIDIVTTPFSTYIEPQIDIIEDLTILNNPNLGAGSSIPGQHVAIDFETTGKKPHAVGHRIVCVAIADSENHAFAFMMPKTLNARQPLINLLINQKIGKFGHNIKFEHTWSLVRLSTEIQNWEWDTMIATHIFDNRRYITGLKFQAYINFGVVDYSSVVDSYLKSDESSANNINRIQELLKRPEGQENLLKYCALDTIYTYRLAVKQQTNLLPF
jgi:uracil-DNA glycosylase family 4